MSMGIYDIGRPLSKRALWNCYLIVMIAAFIGGWICSSERHSCPRPSIEYVQTEINRAVDPAIFPPLVVDGTPGDKTNASWAFISPTWQAENEQRKIKESEE